VWDDASLLNLDFASVVAPYTVAELNTMEKKFLCVATYVTHAHVTRYTRYTRYTHTHTYTHAHAHAHTQAPVDDLRSRPPPRDASHCLHPRQLSDRVLRLDLGQDLRGLLF
jgi:hypothetical protein